MNIKTESHVVEYERKLANMAAEVTVALKTQELAPFGSREADEAFRTIHRIVQEAKDSGMASGLVWAVEKRQQ